MTKNLFLYIILAVVLGVAGGAAAHEWMTPEQTAVLAENLRLVSDIFLRLVKMIIAPLVLTTLAVGVAHIGTGGGVGRIGGRTIAWFIVASLISLGLGLLMVNLLQPGVAFDPGDAAREAAAGATAPAAANFSLQTFLSHVVPTSIVDAMARNEVLQIVVFSCFLGAALAALGEKTARITELLEQGAHVMLRVTEYVMVLAPFAVFASLGAVVATKGLGVLLDYAAFVGGFFLSLGLLWIILIVAGFLVLGRRVFELLATVREPAVIAFSTASSEAAYPKLFEQLEKFGVATRVVSFVLPLGYAFNLDGTMMFCAFATLFIAQASGIELTAAQQIFMLLTLMITSKGIAGVPRASIVVIAATLAQFNLPAEGLLLIIGVDAFLDMGRTATNVVGNSIATAVIAKWEGLLRDPKHDPPAPAVEAGSAATASSET